MGGFSLGEVDLLCWVMSKKKLVIMVSMKEVFLVGVNKWGYLNVVVEQVFVYIDQFVNYGFNCFYVVVYLKMVFEMVYLKVYFLVEFLVVLMEIDLDISKVWVYFSEVK